MMETGNDAQRLERLKKHRKDLEFGSAGQRLPASVIASNLRELDREIATLERLLLS